MNEAEALRKKTMEHCGGSRDAASNHPVFNSPHNSGPDPLRVCRYCDKLVHTSNGKLRAHGRYLNLAATQ